MRCLFAIAAALIAAACGGGSTPSTSPSPTGTSNQAPVMLSVNAGTAELTRTPGRPTIDYQWCYNIGVTSGAQGPFTIVKFDQTVIGPDGTVYGTTALTWLEGDQMGGAVLGNYGCPVNLRDPDTARPVATTYRSHLEYTGPTGSHTVVATGTFVSRVPTQPLMDGISLSASVAEGVPVKRGTPMTFTATGRGGVPPYQFRWTASGFLLRDWDSSPTLTWDAVRYADGTAAGGAGWDLLVYGRSTGGSSAEASTSFFLRVAD